MRFTSRWPNDVQRRWSLLFSIASIITPILLGTILGAIASGTIRVENGMFTSGFFQSWLAPFPIAVGLFALALFAFLAAVYLTLETREQELQDDFRRRALLSGVVVGLLALTVFVLAKSGAPTVRAGISRSWWALGLHLFTAIFATGAFYTLWTRRYRLARVCAAAQVTLILLGWAFASVSAPRGTRHHDHLSGRTADYSATVARRPHSRRDSVVSVLLLLVPDLQKSADLTTKSRRH